MTVKSCSYVCKGGVIRSLLAYTMAMSSVWLSGCSAVEPPAPYLRCEGSFVQLDAPKLEYLMSQVNQFMATTTSISKSYAEPSMVERKHGALVRLANPRQVSFRQPWMREIFYRDVLAIKFHGDKSAITTYLIGADDYIVTILGGDRKKLEGMLQVYGCRM